VAEGYLLTPEPVDEVRILLPRGISFVASEPYGGASRITISGADIEAGRGYQFVSTDGPLMRVIELVPNPAPEA